MNKTLAIRFIEYMREYRDDPMTRKAIIDTLVLDNDLKERLYTDYIFTDGFGLQLVTLSL